MVDRCSWSDTNELRYVVDKWNWWLLRNFEILKSWDWWLIEVDGRWCFVPNCEYMCQLSITNPIGTQMDSIVWWMGSIKFWFLKLYFICVIWSIKRFFGEYHNTSTSHPIGVLWREKVVSFLLFTGWILSVEVKVVENHTIKHYS